MLVHANPLTFIKLGGSVITDKRGQEAPDLPMIQRLVTELRTVWQTAPDQRLLLGHGSGSFGHFYAARYGVHRGLAPTDDWIGFAQTSGAALRLNRMVVDALLAADLPALALQPSASLQSSAGELTMWQTSTIGQALDHGLIPVIHGDVAFDTLQGSAIISTEALFAYLVLHTDICPTRIILVGEAALYTADPHAHPMAEPIPLITPANIEQVLCGAGASHAVDVTGGMYSKLQLMWRLVQARPGLEVYLIGPTPGLLAAALQGHPVSLGTIIRGQHAC